MAKKEKRFVRTSVESTSFEENSVWVDREGKPIITTVLDEEE